MLNRFVHVSRCRPRPYRLLRPRLSQSSSLRRKTSSAIATSHSASALEDRSAFEYAQLLHAYEASGPENRTVPKNIQHGTKDAKDRSSKVNASEAMVVRMVSSNRPLAPTTGPQYAERRRLRFMARKTSRTADVHKVNASSPSSARNHPSTKMRTLIRTSKGNVTTKATFRLVGSTISRRGHKVLRHAPGSSARRRRCRSRLAHKAYTQRLWNRPKLEKSMARTHWVSLNAWSADPPDVVPVSASKNPEWFLNKFDTAWSVEFSRLNDGHRLDIELTSDIAYLLEKYAGLSRRRSSKPQILFDIENKTWQDTMLWCLQNSPMRALQFLLATIRGHRFRPPRNLVEDCLHFLSRHYLYKASKPGLSAMHALWRLTHQFVDGVNTEDVRTYSVPHSLVRLLLRYGDDAQALSLYKLLVFNRVSLQPDTMLHFLERFVNMEESDMAMKLLARILISDFPISKDQVQSACVRLLRAPRDVEEPYAIQSRMLTQMLELGIKPNTHMYNVILLNMIEAHDFNTAWQTYDMAKRNNFVTDSITCGILLKGAKLSGNANILDLVFREAREDPEKLQDLRLVSDVLSTIYVFSPGDEYPSMLDFYKQYCDLQPLQELGLCGPETKPIAGTEVVGATPTKHILGQMIGAYNKLHQSSNGLIHRYNLYHDLVRENHTVIAPLAQEDYVANSFILAFGKRPETLQHSTTVIKHMLEAPPSPDQPAYAVPTVRTWSILAASYFRHNQRLAAEKVFSMMRERGLKPDKVTWNTMISGYSGLQDVEAAVGAVKGMQAAGHEVNSYTLKGLGKLLNRSRLLDALKRVIGDEAPVQKGSSTENSPSPVEEVNAMAKGWESEGSAQGKEFESYS